MGRSTRPSAGPPHEVMTIGYEGASVQAVVSALRAASVDVLVDVRAIANSRRPGFAKKSLAANLSDAGIDYLHIRPLGTPAEGRAEARAGHPDRMKVIFLRHLEEQEAQDGLAELARVVESGRRVCLLCLEARPEHCHRTLVAEALEELVPLTVVHLRPAATAPSDHQDADA